MSLVHSMHHISDHNVIHVHVHVHTVYLYLITAATGTILGSYVFLDHLRKRIFTSQISRQYILEVRPIHLLSPTTAILEYEDKSRLRVQCFQETHDFVQVQRVERHADRKRNVDAERRSHFPVVVVVDKQVLIQLVLHRSIPGDCNI